jgi:glycosyltransferase involved in cell wall biosynthesis
MESTMTSDFSQRRFTGTVIIYNLITDENNPVMAFGLDWIREFAEISTEILVFSTHVGNYTLPSNVKVFELGGGSTKNRALGAAKLIKSLVLVLSLRGKKIVFHHMSEKTAFLLGPLYRLFGIKQGLWYSHNRKSRILVFATKSMNYIFTPTLNSFPINSRKVCAVGHGISMAKFEKYKSDLKKRSGILSLGRISKVKRLETIIDALSLVPSPRPTLTFIGPIMEKTGYVDALKSRADASHVELYLKDSTPYAEIPELLSRFSMAFSGSPNTVDKSVLEAAATGCFVLSENQFVLELTGMRKVWNSIGIETPGNLASQIATLKQYEEDFGLRKLIAETCKVNNDVKSTATKILSTLAADEA